MAGSSETRTADGIGTGETAGSEDSARIAGEASHAAGNLIHRLYYLAEVIEGDSGSDDIPEALSELKEALGELHTLVARSMALLRPVKVETTRYSCVDIALSIAQGFGGDGSEIKAETPSPVLDELTGREADVDPTQLAHAVGLLSDVLHGEKPETARSGLICIRTAIRTVFDSKEAAGKKVFGFFVTVLKKTISYEFSVRQNYLPEQAPGFHLSVLRDIRRAGSYVRLRSARDRAQEQDPAELVARDGLSSPEHCRCRCGDPHEPRSMGRQRSRRRILGSTRRMHPLSSTLPDG